MIGNVLAVLFVMSACCVNQFVHGQTGCFPNPCYNAGTCYYIGIYPVCACATGFTGYNCQQRKLKKTKTWLF